MRINGSDVVLATKKGDTSSSFAPVHSTGKKNEHNKFLHPPQHYVIVVIKKHFHTNQLTWLGTDEREHDV
ncbi:hypothetical protein C0J52_04332 [Blattella germanica]|nr:hypothetical protein C0J52_04332 [Blattella germanica]